MARLPTPLGAPPTSCARRWDGCAGGTIPTPLSPSAVRWMSASPSPSASAKVPRRTGRPYPTATWRSHCRCGSFAEPVWGAQYRPSRPGGGAVTGVAGSLTLHDGAGQLRATEALNEYLDWTISPSAAPPQHPLGLPHPALRQSAKCGGLGWNRRGACLWRRATVSPGWGAGDRAGETAGVCSRGHWGIENRLLGQTRTQAHSNEITAIPQLLALLRVITKSRDADPGGGRIPGAEPGPSASGDGGIAATWSDPGRGGGHGTASPSCWAERSTAAPTTCWR